MKFKIKKRKFSWKNLWKSVNVTKSKHISFEISITPVKYNVEPITDQGDWLKILGISEHLFHNHKDTVILAHRWLKNHLEFAIYVHNAELNPSMGNKNIHYTILTRIPAQKIYEDSYHITGDMWIFNDNYKIKINNGSIGFAKMIKRTKRDYGYNRIIYPWAGGTGDVIQDLNYDIRIWRK